MKPRRKREIPKNIRVIVRKKGEVLRVKRCWMTSDRTNQLME